MSNKNPIQIRISWQSGDARWKCTCPVLGFSDDIHAHRVSTDYANLHHFKEFLPLGLDRKATMSVGLRRYKLE